MRNAVIPAPRRFDHNGGEFALRSGTTIAYINIDVAPIVESFCLEVIRRTGLRVLPVLGNPGSNEPSIRVELTTEDELGVLPAPRGVSPTGDRPSDERYSLVIDEHRIVVRAAEPVEGAHARLEALCRNISPALAAAPIKARQACFRPVTEDGLPLIGAVPGIDGAYVATGHSVWGMLNAPATGEAMSELILDGAAHRVDLALFAPGRLPPLDPARLRGRSDPRVSSANRAASGA